MKHLFRIFIFFIICPPVSGQNIQLPTEYIRNTLSGSNNTIENIEGSPYVNDNFRKAEISIGENSFTADARYNGLKDAFEVQGKEGELIELVRSEDLIVNFNQDLYQMYSYIGNGTNRGFFKVLSNPNNNTLLLLKQTVVLNEAKKARNTYSRDKPANFELKETYFIKKKNAEAKEVRLRKKDILNILDTTPMKDYVNSQKLKLKSENEVIQALEYYDSLQL